jgi:serine/threonine-protein kinase RsbW
MSLPDELAESGRGPAIALGVLDELSYRRDKSGNHWTLVSRLPGVTAGT